MTRGRPRGDEIPSPAPTPEEAVCRRATLEQVRAALQAHPDLAATFGSPEAALKRLVAAASDDEALRTGTLAAASPKRLRRNSLPPTPKNRPAPDLDELRAAVAVVARLGPAGRPRITDEARRIAQAALDAAQPGDERVRLADASKRAGGVRVSAVRNAVKAVAWHSPDVWVKTPGEPARPMFREYQDTPHDRRMREAYEARSRRNR